MRKRDFRPTAAQGNERTPAIPTLDDFDRDRRSFLARLGAVIGLGALASAAAACGGRAVDETDAGRNQQGFDGGPSGAAPAPDAEIEKKPPLPATDAGRPPTDPDWGLMGDVQQPDARVDSAPDWGIAGGMPAPDARLDPDGMVSPGFAPAMDARVDGTECPN